MARLVEVALVEALEGKTRAEQLQRLNEWKKQMLAQGAESITIYEAGAGNINANWIFTITHESAASFGAVLDKYYANPKSYDDLMEVWQKSPVLKFNGYSITHEIA